MKLNIKHQDAAWWFWFATLVVIAIGLAGYREGYVASAIIAAVNVVAFIVRDKSLVSFAVQVRWVWLAFVLFALWPPAWMFNIALLIGMILVVLFDRCGIARFLILLPWNKNAKLT